MAETSARFGLPMILPGQAQKEVFHNEALAMIDAALHPCVEEGPIAAPPTTGLEEGRSWIVGSGASGAWEGRDHEIATWTAGGWRYVTPIAGIKSWSKADGYWFVWNGSAWMAGVLPASAVQIDGLQVVGPRLPDIPSPSGGTIIDGEARTVLAAVIATLKSHGLIE
jgi:hypothetical protein